MGQTSSPHPTTYSTKSPNTEPAACCRGPLSRACSTKVYAYMRLDSRTRPHATHGLCGTSLPREAQHSTFAPAGVKPSPYGPIAATTLPRDMLPERIMRRQPRREARCPPCISAVAERMQEDVPCPPQGAA